MKRSKKTLEIKLSKLSSISNPKIELEQYSTDPILASDMVNMAFMNGDIEGKTILDAGAGNGIFSYACLYFGASKVSVIEIDPDQEKILDDNLAEFSNKEIIIGNIEKIEGHWDTVICNVPFGSVIEDIDIPFLEKIFHLGDAIYLIHNWKAREFVLNFVSSRSEIIQYTKKRLIIPRTYKHHEKDRVFIDVLLIYAKRK
ncbi:MAG: METTL5 family protein [Cuniculiplasma sp.]